MNLIDTFNRSASPSTKNKDFVAITYCVCVVVIIYCSPLNDNTGNYSKDQDDNN